MKPAFIAISFFVALGGLTASAADPAFRQLGKHQHGHGSLDIAIENKKVSLELHAPGADIVGFEHEPQTDAEKAALTAAKAQLQAPLSLFNLPPEAQCQVTGSDVAFTEEEHDDDGDHDHDHDKAHDHANEAGGHHHSDVHASYSLECAAPEKLTNLTVNYFKTFANAQSLEVTAIGPKGQKAAEISRTNPTLDLSGAL